MSQVLRFITVVGLLLAIAAIVNLVSCTEAPVKLHHPNIPAPSNHRPI